MIEIRRTIYTGEELLAEVRKANNGDRLFVSPIAIIEAEDMYEHKMQQNARRAKKLDQLKLDLWAFICFIPMLVFGIGAAIGSNQQVFGIDWACAMSIATLEMIAGYAILAICYFCKKWWIMHKF